MWEIKFTDRVTSGSGSSNAGLVIGCILAAVAVIVTVSYFVLPKELHEKIFGKKKVPYVIPAGEIDEEDMDAYNKFIKRK